ncbi:MAG: TauD/TfdA family dioxygenase [Proteobacteria bacterium]|nr:TauD/TfdA family dioxygenase [Pseudomonadota bacterium]
MSLQIEPLSAALGARITGVDLREPLDGETFRRIHQAALDHLVLVFPGQELGVEDQLRFSGLFGEVGGRNRTTPLPEGDRVPPTVMLVSNIRVDGKPIGSLPDGEMMFHTDGAYTEKPKKFTLLYAIDVPATGGNTRFANLYKAYETLPDDLKRRLAGCHAEQVFYTGSVQKHEPAGPLSGSWVHPVFIEHPDTGRTSLFVSRLMTTRIMELPEEESVGVLERLNSHAEKPEVIFEHAWTPGDLVMWDDRCTNHARTHFAETERRQLRRTTVTGTALAAARIKEAAAVERHPGG